MSLGDVYVYYRLQVDWLDQIPNGDNSRVADNREVKDGGVSLKDSNICH